MSGSPEHWLGRLPGSSAFLDKLKEEMAVMRDWHQYFVFFFSSSLSAATDDLLSTFVSHSAGMEGREEQVWHTEDEQARLVPRQGRLRPEGEGYFVHCKVGVEDSSCPFHPYCNRLTLEAWRDR